jgi:hypothetical protein
VANRYHKTIVAILIMFFGFSVGSNAAVGVLSCMPKNCCCKSESADVMDLMDHRMSMEMPGPLTDKCESNPSAPCCRVKSNHPLKAGAAIPTAPLTNPNRIIKGKKIPTIGAITVVQSPQLPWYRRFSVMLDIGSLNSLSVPIYLYTLSILC